MPKDDTRQDLGWAVKTVAARERHYRLYSDYYRGRHNQVFEIATEAHARSFRALLERVKENLCKAVVRCFAERTAIDGWMGSGADAAQRMMKERYMTAIANRVHTEALKTGDAYLLVWPDTPDTERRLFRQPAEQMATAPDPKDPEQVRVAAKVWREKGNMRVNLYYADRLERWSAKYDDGTPKAADFVPYEDDDGEATIRHSFGRVPVVRFANDAPDTAEAGVSLLEDVLPLQDVLNKTLADMLIASEFFALPMRVFTGVTAEIDPRTGKTQAETFDPRRDRNLFFGGTDTRAFTLPAGDLRQVVEITDSIALKIARVTGVPLHYLVLGQGQFPSGEALRTAEARLVSRVTDLHDEWGPRWSEVMALMGVPDVEVKWVDPAHITESERIETLEAKRRLGVPWEELMKDLGYGPDEIPLLQAMKDDERRTAGAAFSAAFDAGEGEAVAE